MLLQAYFHSNENRNIFGKLLLAKANLWSRKCVKGTTKKTVQRDASEVKHTEQTKQTDIIRYVSWMRPPIFFRVALFG